MWLDITMREKIILGLLAVLLLTGAIWRLLPRSEPAGMARVDRESAQQETEPETVVVHLVGAVQNPGVYRLPAGSRVYDLLVEAGGHTEEADLEKVNLARPLFDGEQVEIYRAGEGPPADQGTAGVNINRASAEELATLPGIGPVRAEQIVEHREKHGYFNEITEIMDVSGIGEGIFNSIKDRITVY